MSKEELTWQDVYQLPLTSDGSGYLWTQSGVMALQFDRNVSKESRQKVKNLINGESVFKIAGITNDGCDFLKDYTHIFCIRGWGHLTGSGALNLPHDKAVEIQDGFIDYILKQIS